MAFCSKGKCKFTKKSKSGYPQCNKCGRVNLSGKKKVARKSSKKRTTSVSKSWSPGMADLRGRASYIIQKQTNARTNYQGVINDDI